MRCSQRRCRANSRSRDRGAVLFGRQEQGGDAFGNSPVQGNIAHGSTNKGIEIARLRLACAAPGEQPSQFSEALLRLGENAAYLYSAYSAGENYWFSPIASLNQEAEDRAKALSGAEVEAEIVTLISAEEKHKGTGFLRVPRARSRRA
jgi:hypothetical protein